MRGVFICIFMPALACVALSQEFEVVSVKANRSGSNGSDSRSDPSMLTAVNVSLRSLIVRAYGMKDFQVEGPPWLNSERFDIAAKFPDAFPKDRDGYNAGLRAMMQKMLADRFKLAVHQERKVLSVYGLVAAKGGIKFKEAPEGPSNSQSRGTHYEGTSVTMAKFAEFLERRLELPVLDMSGLKGVYNLTLDWVPEPRQSAERTGDSPVADSPSGPTLTVAIQEQLGLKLEMRKAPIEILVVDHAERAPTEN